MSAQLWIAAVVAACGAPCVHAETLYVIEQVVVGVNSAPDGSGERVGQIKSAEQVELLERQEEQAHVRLPSGAEGWVKASYLTSDPPLRTQLNTRSEELERIRKEKAQLESELAAAKTAAANAVAQAKAAAKNTTTVPPPAAAVSAPEPAPVTSSPAPDAAPAEAGSNPPPLFHDEPMVPSRPSWLLATGVALFTLAAGFVLGWWLLDRRIRAKYGGLRIY